MKTTVSMKSLIAVLTLTVAFSLLLTPSFSFANAWTAAGSTGTIDESYLDNFQTNLSYINFRPGMAGTIIARYNVTNPFDSDIHNIWNALYLSYMNSNDDSSIWVYLRSVNLETGRDSTIVTFDSRDYSNSYSTQLRYVTFYHLFDFSQNAYYIEVVMKRTSSSVNTPKLYSLKLDTYLY